MASYDDDVIDVLDSVYAEFGMDAVLKRDGEPDMACRLILGTDTSVEYADFGGGGKNLTDQNYFKIRAADVDGVKQGDVIELHGVDYAVNVMPELLDRKKLEYSIKAKKVVA